MDGKEEWVVGCGVWGGMEICLRVVFDGKEAQPGGVLCVTIGVMTTEGRDDNDGLDRQDDEALWALLGRQTPPAQAGPYFSRRVLREVALAERARSEGWHRRVWRALLPTDKLFRRTALWSGVFSGACALTLICVSHESWMPRAGTTTRQQAATDLQPSPAGTPLAATQAGMAVETDAAVPVQEVEVIADLDNILEREESRLWTDDTARF